MDSQWRQLKSTWPFLSRHEQKFAAKERAALYSYLRDPAQWGISWDALVSIENDAKKHFGGEYLEKSMLRGFLIFECFSRASRELLEVARCPRHREAKLRRAWRTNRLGPKWSSARPKSFGVRLRLASAPQRNFKGLLRVILKIAYFILFESHV